MKASKKPYDSSNQVRLYLKGHLWKTTGKDLKHGKWLSQKIL